MSAFVWRGRGSDGELVQGVIDANDGDAVADQLLATGIAPLSISARVSTPATGAWQALHASPVNAIDLLMLTRQFYTLYRARVPILRALAGLQASGTKPAVLELLGNLRASLDQGHPLAAAMARHPRVFSNFYVAMIRVGETTGRLTESLERLCEHLEYELDMRARIKQALRYPTMVLAAIVIALVIVNLFVLPTFAKVFAGFKAQLPLMTRVLLGFSDWMTHSWPLLLGGAIAAAWGLRAALATPAGRYRWDRLKLRLPVAGPIVLKSTLARFARSFAMAMRSGVPITQAMTLVSQTVDNTWVGRRIERMREGIERGESLSRCAVATGVFTPMVLQMISVGEETGELDSLMTEIAALYERDVDYAIKGLATSIEPLLLLVIGALVLVLALGIFMPLWDLGQAVRGGH